MGYVLSWRLYDRQDHYYHCEPRNNLDFSSLCTLYSLWSLKRQSQEIIFNSFASWILFHCDIMRMHKTKIWSSLKFLLPNICGTFRNFILLKIVILVMTIIRKLIMVEWDWHLDQGMRIASRFGTDDAKLFSNYSCWVSAL